MEKENKTGQLQLNLRPEIATGVYSNLALISHSKTDFVLDFCAHLPGMPKADVVSRVIMTPEHAKRLVAALQDNIMKYEREFGVIDLSNGNDGRTANPFGAQMS